jgi:hypothetical protein
VNVEQARLAIDHFTFFVFHFFAFWRERDSHLIYHPRVRQRVAEYLAYHEMKILGFESIKSSKSSQFLFSIKRKTLARRLRGGNCVESSSFWEDFERVFVDLWLQTRRKNLWNIDRRPKDYQYLKLSQAFVTIPPSNLLQTPFKFNSFPHLIPR